MLNHATLLEWTRDAVDAANAAPRSSIGSIVAKAACARGAEMKSLDRARSAIGLYAQLTGVTALRASLGFDSRGALMLAAVHGANAEQRAALACVELCQPSATVEIGRCRRANCRRFLVNDFGPGARRPYWYCTLPDGTTHRLTPKERNDKSNAKRAAARAAVRAKRAADKAQKSQRRKTRA